MTNVTGDKYIGKRGQKIINNNDNMRQSTKVLNNSTNERLSGNGRNIMKGKQIRDGMI